MHIRGLVTMWPLALSALCLVGAGSRAQDQAATPMIVTIRIVESSAEQARKNPDLDGVIKAGGKLVGAPTLQVLSGMPAQMEERTETAFEIPTGDGNQPARKGVVSVGLTMKATPDLNPDGTVQLGLDVTSNTLGPGGPPEVVRQGFFNCLRLKGGAFGRFGAWTVGKKVRTVFASAAPRQP